MWNRRARISASSMTLALVAAASTLLLLFAGPAAAGRLLTTQVTLAAYDQEPGAVVTPRVTTRDQAGHPISGVRCVVTWRLPQGPASKVRVSGVAGVVRDPRRIAGLPADTQVTVVVRSTWRGQVSRCRTWFRVQRPVPAEPTILFVGDSITLGMFAIDEYGCYRSLVAQRFPCLPLTAASTGGKSADVDLESVRTAAAGIVVVELGTNDASGHPGTVPVDPAVFRRNLHAIAEAARSGNADARLVFLTIWQGPRKRRAYRRPHRRRRGGLRAPSGLDRGDQGRPRVRRAGRRLHVSRHLRRLAPQRLRARPHREACGGGDPPPAARRGPS